MVKHNRTIPRFELDRLVAHGDADLLDELRRVAKIVAREILTVSEFNRHSRVHPDTIRHRFGSWHEALVAAGLAPRYSGQIVTSKMRVQAARKLTNEEILSELRSVAAELEGAPLTAEALEARSPVISPSVVRRRFGSWKKGVLAAGLIPAKLGSRYGEDEYFENMLAVWTHHGRTPRYREMNLHPSRISAGAYEKKWGTWSRAKLAFINRANSDVSLAQSRAERTSLVGVLPKSPASCPTNPANRKTIPLGLRYSILRRDRFACVLCGASPSAQLGCELHVDHILAFANGGKTVPENLRTLCSDCNLGKGKKRE